MRRGRLQAKENLYAARRPYGASFSETTLACVKSKR